MRLLPRLNLSSPVAAALVPADRFFMRLVPLAPDLPVPGQVELALEGLAPFPVGQLYWGACVAPDRRTALVYAAHRRRFSAEETAAWERAEVVVPDIVALAGCRPEGSAVVLLADGPRVNGAAWTGHQAWPAAVQARAFLAAPTEDERQHFAQELAGRAGLANPAVRLVSATPRVRREGDGIVLELVDVAGSTLSHLVIARADEELLDIRDRAFLARRRRNRQHGELVWRVLLGGVAAAGLAAVLDLAALGLRLATRAEHLRVTAQAPYVAKLETANGLTSRVDELTHRRLRFFEMLAVINEPRPHSIQFNRTGTSGHHALEIEAQTNSADDVGTYEAALRRLPALEKVEIRDLRARDGVTTFGLSVAFKAEGGGTTPGGAP
ncbi:MAG TPA: hypothetical protein VHD61_00010 [Lacunisphaera sp.]|nr:hypothetical protein [Lacunisphaera sp.]